jgi:hypothetical protein
VFRALASGTLYSPRLLFADALRLVQLSVVLILGLLVLTGRPLDQLAGGSVGGAAVSGAAFPRVGPLATNSTTTNVSTLNLNGTWQNAANGDTYAVLEQPIAQSNGSVRSWFFGATYLTDPGCPGAIGSEYISSGYNTSGIMQGIIGKEGYMKLCTPATNPVVADCGQPAFWTTSFNATVSPDIISGYFLDQYWTWDTGANGSVTNCEMEYNFWQPFSLTPVFASANSSSASGTSQQGTGSTTPPTVQASGHSTSSSSSTSTKSGLGGLLPVGLAILLVVVAAVFVVIKWRPRNPRVPPQPSTAT